VRMKPPGFRRKACCTEQAHRDNQVPELGMTALSYTGVPTAYMRRAVI